MTNLISLFPICIVLIGILAEIRIFRIYRRTGLQSHLLLVVGGMIVFVGMLGGFGVLWLNIPNIDFENMRFLIPISFFMLIEIFGVILGTVATALMMTRDIGVLKELRRRTTRLQWLMGNVPRIEQNMYPPIGKKWIGVATGVGIIIIPGAILAIFAFKMTSLGLTGALAIFILYLIFGGLLIGFSIIYFKEPKKDRKEKSVIKDVGEGADLKK